MCVIFLSTCNAHPDLFALLAFNRDEFLARPTSPLGFWDPPRSTVLAGRDLVHGGTWLGLTTQGRFACLTNFREVNYATNRPNRRSRGALIVDFLTASCSPSQYVQDVDNDAFDGFNVIVGDLQTTSVSYTTNRAGGSHQDLAPGMYGLSNGVLHQGHWPKVDAGVAKLQDILRRESNTSTGFQVPWEALFEELLGDARKVQDLQQLPVTGMPLELEQLLSSIFVEPCDIGGSVFGTRSKTVVAIWKDGRVEAQERFLDTEKGSWGAVCYAFQASTGAAGADAEENAGDTGTSAGIGC